MLRDVVHLTSYDLSVYALPTFAAAAAILLLGIGVLIRERHSLGRMPFFITTLTIFE